MRLLASLLRSFRSTSPASLTCVMGKNLSSLGVSSSESEQLTSRRADSQGGAAVALSSVSFLSLFQSPYFSFLNK